jgi:hypothetical protein
MTTFSYVDALDQVADTLEIGLILLDTSLTIISVNCWICERAKQDKHSLLGKRLDQAFELTQDSRLLTACKQSIEHGLPAKISNRLNPFPLPL